MTHRPLFDHSDLNVCRVTMPFDFFFKLFMVIAVLIFIKVDFIFYCFNYGFLMQYFVTCFFVSRINGNGGKG